MKKQNLSIGAFVNRLSTVDELLSHKNLLKHRFVISSLYGTFPNVIWNGGRTLIQSYSNITNEKEWYKARNYLWYDPRGMESLIRSYNDRGIGIRYTYSNSLIKKKHLGDKRANLTLEMAHNSMNAVITGNPFIEEYVRKYYPKFKIISSATSQRNLSVPFLKKRIDEVDLLVLPPEFNDRYDLITRLGVDKLEILINERCAPHCPNRSAHYAAISKSQICWDSRFEGECYAQHCPVYRAKRQNAQIETMVLSDKKITALQKLGVHHFKFVGRHLSKDQFIAEVDGILIKERFRVSQAVRAEAYNFSRS
jgi:collagenase-like PrtC family protease